MRLDDVSRVAQFAVGFFFGGLAGALIGGGLGLWMAYHHHIAHKPLERMEMEWAWIWPFALGFGLLVGLAMAFRVRGFIGGLIDRFRDPL